MTGPVPRHDHQTLDQWAQQGLVNSEGRTSPESDLPDVPDGAQPEGIRPTTTPATSVPTDGDVTDEVTERGAPGTSADPGDLAESAAFTGDGAYSEGRHAAKPSAG